jgi:hypothetical protein
LRIIAVWFFRNRVEIEQEFTMTLFCGRGFVRWGCVALLAVALWGLAPGRSAAEVRRVLIIPFSIHADKDLAFLRKGITAMLSSRLTDVGKVVVLDQSAVADSIANLPDPLTREVAAEAGRKAGADYVAFGSLTVFGDSISTDARFVEASTNTILVTFSDTGQSQGDVISHVNDFASEVNGRVFGQRAETQEDRTASSGTAPAAPTDPDQVNPEKAIWGKDGGMRIQATDPDVDHTGARLWRSRRFQFQIQGLGLGDVDGDGAVETVFASDQDVAVYRSLKGQFLKVAEFKAESDFVCVALDVADINANGKAEIFLIGRTEKFWPKTIVLEWDGAQFQEIQTITDWFFRVNHDPKTGRAMLYGQKGWMRQMGQRDTINPVVQGPLYRMAWMNGAYEPQQTYPIPDEGTVFGFAYGDMTGDGLEDWIVYDDNERLHLVTPGNRDDWSSSEPYGGRYTYLMSAGVYRERQRPNKLDFDELPMELFFVPQRVLMTDFDKDGRNEVLVVQNYDITQGLLQRSRSFRDGHFECLSWDNVGLRALWRTRKFSGYISDFNLGDFDNDGRQEMVFAVVKKMGDPFTGESKSYLVSWDPYQTEGKEKAE